jgi:alanine racemase
MDQTMVDIGWNSAFNGDRVTLMGSDGDECITAEDLAQWADTISYEILTNIAARVPRRYRPSGPR